MTAQILSQIRADDVSHAVRRLVFDKIDSDFHPSTHVALGSWCFVDSENTYPEWETLEFVELTGSAQEQRLESDCVRRLCSALLDDLYPEMNRCCGVNYSRNFWHIVLFNWLLHLVMLSWRVWRHVELFVAKVGAEHLDVSLPTATARFKFADTAEFVVACYTAGAFRTWLMSETVRQLAPPQWTLRNGIVLEPSEAASPAPTPRGRWLVGNITGMRRWQRWALSSVITLRPRKPASFGPLIAAETAAFPSAYRDFVARLVGDTLPESLRHGFTPLDDAAKLRKYRPGRIRVLNTNANNDHLNLVLAHAVEAGERVVDVQHGGVYGTAALAPCAPDLAYCYDTFVSWGWTEHAGYDGRFRPLPSPLLNQLARERRKPGGDIIFVGTMMSSFNPRFDYCAEPLEYRRWKRRFLAGLANQAMSDLHYRPYFTRVSFDDAAWLHRFFPDLRVLAGNLDQALQTCRLAVLDYPGTTLAQTLAADIPTICFWNKKQWHLSPLAQPYFDRLEAAGIAFDNPEAAAAQVNAVLPGLETWWQSREVQRAREQWCHEFARADRRWLFKWLKAFATL